MNELFKLASDYIKARWHRKSTLVILVLFVTFSLLFFFNDIDITSITLLEIAIIGFVVLAAILFWIISNRIPRTPKGKIGFGIAITSENTGQEQQLASDFINTLDELLHQSKLKYHFKLIVFPRHISEKINPETALEYQRKAGLHFLVFGRVRTRQLKGEVHHVLNMEGLVTHKPIPHNVQQSFAKEFSELFPKKLIISSEGDIFAFEFTAKWVNFVARYIIGTAALISGDIEFSTELFEYLLSQTRNIKTDVPPLVKIRNRTPRRLTEIYLTYVRFYFEQWKLTRESPPLDKMKPYLDKLKLLSPKNFDGNNFRSIWLFLVERDVTSAKIELQKARKINNVVWRYNLGFLDAYEGNMKAAIKEYKKASVGYLPEPKVLDEIVDFIYWIIEKEPQKCQLYFCLGLINFLSKKDYSRALQEFEIFIEITPPELFPEAILSAEGYIQTIQKELEKKKIVEE